MKKASTVAAARERNRAPSDGTDFDPRQLLSALMAFKHCDFSARLPENWTGAPGKVTDTFNVVIETNERMTRELERIDRVVGNEGRIAQRASIGETLSHRSNVLSTNAT
jgi:hypothetical protein